MGLEIEAKFRLPDPAKLRDRLLAAGARLLGAVLEHNTYFDTPDEALRKSDCGLRIRTVAGEGQATLTYKGPRRAGDLKVRQEEEMVISSPAAAEAILKGLGYRARLSFQKRRESFLLGGARVELDELPELGFFAEVEAESAERVRAVRHELGLDEKSPITDTYAAIVSEHLAGSGRKQLEF